MAREFARVKLSIWDDDDFRSLPIPAQHLYFLLLTAPSLTYCGTVDWRPARLSGMAGEWGRTEVEAAAYILAERRYIIIDEATEEALIRSFIRHDGLMTKPRMAVSMVNAHRAVASLAIRGVIVHELQRLHAEDANLGGWKDIHGGPGAALDLLDRDAIDPADLAADLWSVCPSVCNAFATNGPSGLHHVCTPPTPAPTPTTSDIQTSPSKNLATDVAGEMDRFDEFWNVYGKKVKRADAEKKWAKALTKVDADRIISAAAAYVAHERETNEGGRYIADASTWLHGERWRDERTDLPLPQTNLQKHMALVAQLGEESSNVSPFRQIGSKP